MASTTATTTDPQPHIAILPSPGMGHLIPLAEFAKRLNHHHNFTATFFIPTDNPVLSKAYQSFLSTLSPSIDYVLLPPVSFDDLPPGSCKIETFISLTIVRSLPSMRDALKSLVGAKKVSAFVVDLFGTDAFDVAREFGIPPYIFFCSTAMTLGLFLYLPKLDETVSCEFMDVPEKLKIPGCVPIHGRDLLDPVQDRKNDAYKWVLHHAKRCRLAEGIVVNSFKELEPGAIEALVEKEDGKPTVYAVGPLIRMDFAKPEERDESHGCLKWLDEQPMGSVLYVSFGSGGTLSHDQMVELASGMEMSEHRFLWVVRCPNDASSNATYFSIDNVDDPLAYLPPGFLDRTRGRGLAVPLWAPQAEILSHKSVCAFLTHCGWNSILESLVHGVPMIAWPLYAEQRMNAVMLYEDIKLALRPKVGENGLVGRVEIMNVLEGLMEGEEGIGIRSQMNDLKEAAARVLSENGSSTKTLAELANKWKGNACT